MCLFSRQGEGTRQLHCEGYKSSLQGTASRMPCKHAGSRQTGCNGTALHILRQHTLCCGQQRPRLPFAPGRSIRMFKGALPHLLVWPHALCYVCACLRLSRFALHSVCAKDCFVTARVTKSTWQIRHLPSHAKADKDCATTGCLTHRHWTNRTQTKHKGRYTQAQTHHAAHSVVRSCLNSDLRLDQKTYPSLYTHVALKPTPLPGVMSQQGPEGQFVYGPANCRSRLHVSRSGAAVHDRQQCSSSHGRQPALCGIAGRPSMQSCSILTLPQEPWVAALATPRAPVLQACMYASQHTLDLQGHRTGKPFWLPPKP